MISVVFIIVVLAAVILVIWSANREQK